MSFRRSFGALLDLAQQGAHLRHDLGELASDDGVGIGFEQRARRLVGQGDGAVGVEADHARRHPREHGLGEAAPQIELAVGLDQLAALDVELARHAVERSDQDADLVIVGQLRDLDVEGAAADPVGGVDQGADRRDEPVRERQAEPHRRQQEQQRDHDEGHHERDLDERALAFGPLVFGDRAPILLDMGDNARVDSAPGIEEGVAGTAQLHQRPHQFAVPGEQDRLAFVGARRLDRFRRYLPIVQRVAQRRAGDQPGARIEDDRLREAAQRDLGRQHAIVEKRVAVVGIGDVVEIVDHRQRIAAHQLPVLLHVGLGHDDRGRERGLDPLVEPVVDAVVQEQGREHGDDDGRGDGHHAE